MSYVITTVGGASREFACAEGAAKFVVAYAKKWGRTPSLHVDGKSSFRFLNWLQDAGLRVVPKDGGWLAFTEEGYRLLCLAIAKGESEEHGDRSRAFRFSMLEAVDSVLPSWLREAAEEGEMWPVRDWLLEQGFLAQVVEMYVSRFWRDFSDRC